MTVAPSSPAGLVSRTRPLPDAGDLLDALGADGVAWLHDGGGLATAGVADRIAVPTGPDRFGEAAEEVAARLADIDTDDPLQLPGSGPIAIGALPFLDSAPGELIVPAVVVGCTAQGRAWVTHTGPSPEDGARYGVRAAPGAPGPGGPDGPTGGGEGGCGGEGGSGGEGGCGFERWTAAVRRALAAIAAGPLAKVVLAREVVVDGPVAFDRRLVLDRLRAADAASFTYAVGGFVGASPELLVRRRGNRVLSRPMAGTAARGRTGAEDDRLAAALVASAKDAEEHALVVGAVRDALGPVCREVVAGARPDAVRLADVTHLATTVAGHLAEPAPTALALTGLLHPTPAVAGLPRADALAAIAGLESFDRGLYAGPVGWVDARGDGDWAVALRCATLDGRRARLVAGAGIVADSDPAAEWAETEAKLQPMLRALGAG